MTDASGPLLRAIVELVRELPPDALSVLSQHLETNGAASKWGDLSRFAATGAMRERLRRLQELLVGASDVGGHSLSLALQVAACAAAESAAERRTEIAWTGPATEAVPLRRVDQVIYDLVESAKSEVLLITYAAYKADRVLKVLSEATDRGVRVRVILELAEESGGKISFDGLQALRTHVPLSKVYYWPLDRRTRNTAGSYGAMHAKGLVVDRTRALVSSANLTDYALETNMELGLIVEGVTAERLAGHFDQLILRGELTLVP